MSILNGPLFDKYLPSCTYMFGGTDASHSDAFFSVVRYLVLKKSNWEIVKKPQHRLILETYQMFADQIRMSQIVQGMVQNDSLLTLVYGDIGQIVHYDTPEYVNDKNLDAKLKNCGFNWHVYVNKKKQHTFIISDCRWQLLHNNTKLILASLPQLFPWYADAIDEQLKDAILDYFVTGKNEKINTYIDNIPEVKHVADSLYEDGLKEMLKGIGTALTKGLLDDLIYRWKNTTKNLQETWARIASLTDEAERYRCEIEALENSSGKNNQDAEIVEFFLDHKKNITIEYVDKSSILYDVSAPIRYYDEDMLQRIIDNPTSWFNSNSVTPEPVREFVKRIFIDNEAELVTTGVFSIKDLKTVTPNSHCCPITQFPHPHIDHYGCVGGNAQYFRQFAESGEWQLAVEQSIGCISNVNFGDSVVMKEFMRDIYDIYTNRRDIKCVLLKDGTLTTIADFIDNVKEK